MKFDATQTPIKHTLTQLVQSSDKDAYGLIVKNDENVAVHLEWGTGVQTVISGPLPYSEGAGENPFPTMGAEGSTGLFMVDLSDYIHSFTFVALDIYSRVVTANVLDIDECPHDMARYTRLWVYYKMWTGNGRYVSIYSPNTILEITQDKCNKWDQLVCPGFNKESSSIAVSYGYDAAGGMIYAVVTDMNSRSHAYCIASVNLTQPFLTVTTSPLAKGILRFDSVAFFSA
jgi:hypothetical protein